MITHFPTDYNEYRLELTEMIFENYSDGYYSDCVLLSPHKLHSHINEFKELYKNSKIIAYNTIPFDQIQDSFENFDEVWDCDLQNIECWEAKGIQAKFKPTQYASQLKRIKTIDDPDIDVLFIGSPSDHRNKYITNFMLACAVPQEELDLQQNIKFISANQIYGKLKDELISRSKIILNISPYEGAIQQQTRIFYNLINDKCVLSERAPINYFGNMIIQFDNSDDLAAKVRFLLQNDRWKEYSENNFQEYCTENYKGKI